MSYIVKWSLYTKSVLLISFPFFLNRLLPQNMVNLGSLAATFIEILDTIEIETNYKVRWESDLELFYINMTQHLIDEDRVMVPLYDFAAIFDRYRPKYTSDGTATLSNFYSRSATYAYLSLIHI